MTGFGEAHADAPGLSVAVQIRSVNNRHLKVVVRGTDPYPLWDSEVEKVIRKRIRRGTVTVFIRVSRAVAGAASELNTEVLSRYVDQLRKVCRGDATTLAGLLTGVLALPGVAPIGDSLSAPPDEEWALVEAVIDQACASMDEMRAMEGAAMAKELMIQHAVVTGQLAAIQEYGPTVAADYRTRLLERIRQALADTGATIVSDQLVREVALFADRSDISEEITRLKSHLVQYEQIVANETDSPGRKLEFVVQEMGRETNTIGSKAGHATITRHVVEMKAALEKVRELVQNVE